MKRLILALALSFALVSCGGSNPTTVGTPAPPNSPQTQVLNVTKTLADAINTAVKSTIILRDQGLVSQADAVTVESWAASAATVDDQIATELGSSDSWTIQKQKILLSLVGFKLPLVTSNPVLQSALQQALMLAQQIQSAVSQ